MEQKLPSLFQLGDRVSATFPGNGLLKNCKVIKVSFTEHSEPLYDIEVKFNYDGGQVQEDGFVNVGCARIHGLKEWHLRIPDFETQKNESAILEKNLN